MIRQTQSYISENHLTCLDDDDPLAAAYRRQVMSKEVKERCAEGTWESVTVPRDHISTSLPVSFPPFHNTRQQNHLVPRLLTTRSSREEENEPNDDYLALFLRLRRKDASRLKWPDLELCLLMGGSLEWTTWRIWLVRDIVVFLARPECRHTREMRGWLIWNKPPCILPGSKVASKIPHHLASAAEVTSNTTCRAHHRIDDYFPALRSI